MWSQLEITKEKICQILQNRGAQLCVCTGDPVPRQNSKLVKIQFFLKIILNINHITSWK